MSTTKNTPEAEPPPALPAGADPAPILLPGRAVSTWAHPPAFLLYSSCQPIVLILGTILLSHPTSPTQQCLPETGQRNKWKLSNGATGKEKEGE